MKEECRVIGLIVAQSDILVSNAMLAMRPFHGKIERLPLPCDGKTHCGRKTELELGSEELLNVALTIAHVCHPCLPAFQRNGKHIRDRSRHSAGTDPMAQKNVLFHSLYPNEPDVHDEVRQLLIV